MPELPEVETLRRGLIPHLLGVRIGMVKVRDTRLRLPVDHGLSKKISGQTVLNIERRSKYLLFDLSGGDFLVVHLGMSGRLFLLDAHFPMDRHDHVVFSLANKRQLRFRDPRRFGLVVVIKRKEILTHPLFSTLGVEPLTEAFNAEFALKLGQTSKKPIKNFIMDAQKIVGVGNIYANESLFRAGISPKRQTNRLSVKEWTLLVEQIKRVLNQAIAEGGTTLNDFFDSQGNPGYFQQSLFVYGRENEPCFTCGTLIRRIVMSGRSTYYCKQCQ